jgi:hypothetical protein
MRLTTKAAKFFAALLFGGAMGATALWLMPTALAEKSSPSLRRAPSTPQAFDSPVAASRIRRTAKVSPTTVSLPLASGERPTRYHSLPSGAEIEPETASGGHGTLAVINGTDRDAVVRLYDASTLATVRWFFVPAGGTVRKERIPEGTYLLAYTQGLDWIESHDCFRWRPSYSEFGSELHYTEQQTGEGIRYRTVSITLNAVVGGNVSAGQITREDFLRGHQHRTFQP